MSRHEECAELRNSNWEQKERKEDQPLERKQFLYYMHSDVQVKSVLLKVATETHLKLS